MKTQYPKGYVRKKCIVCGWCSNPVKIPDKIPNKSEATNSKRLISDIFNAEWWKL